MNYLGSRITHSIGKILFISFVILHWSVLACSSTPVASGQNNFMAEVQNGQTVCVQKASHACASMLPIIPGAVGPGMTTPAGSGPKRSGGKIIHVTNLKNSGTGSLRNALEANGSRIVVFDVSGYIELQSAISVTEPYLTIAGQTAPFPGITLKGAAITIRTHDVLIQHIRIRVGDGPVGPKPGSRDALTLNGSREKVFNVVIDHVSASWATDENFSTHSNVHDVTLANSIISEGLWHSIHPDGAHSMGMIIGSQTNNLMVIGSILAHNNQRNMRVKGDTSTIFVNNLVYNWRGAGKTRGAAGDYSGGRGILNASIVGNVYIRGRDSRPAENAHPIFLRRDVPAGSKVFIDDTGADTSSIVLVETEEDVLVNASPNWTPSLIAKKSNEVKDWVRNNAGARRSDGDAVDVRIINDVLKGTGRIIDSQNQVGGWPPLANNVRGTGGVPALSIPANGIQPSGYTKVEEWLHRLAEQVEVPK